VEKDHIPKVLTFNFKSKAKPQLHLGLHLLELRRVVNPATPDELDRRDGVNALPLTRFGDQGFYRRKRPVLRSLRRVEDNEEAVEREIPSAAEPQPNELPQRGTKERKNRNHG